MTKLYVTALVTGLLLSGWHGSCANAVPLCWSSDSTCLYYVNANGAVVTVNRTTRGVTPVWTPPADLALTGDIAVSEVGKRLAAVSRFINLPPDRADRGLVMRTGDGRLGGALPVPHYDFASPPANLSWSPDGRYLAFVAGLTLRGNPNLGPFRELGTIACGDRSVPDLAIWAIDTADQPALLKLVGPRLREGTPAPDQPAAPGVVWPVVSPSTTISWTPDSRAFVFAGALQRPGQAATSALWKHDCETDTTAVLVEGTGTQALQTPAVHPTDGRAYFVVAHPELLRDDTAPLASVKLDGSDVVSYPSLVFGDAYARVKNVLHVALSCPSAMQWSPDGKFLAVTVDSDLVSVAAGLQSATGLAADVAWKHAPSPVNP